MLTVADSLFANFFPSLHSPRRRQPSKLSDVARVGLNPSKNLLDHIVPCKMFWPYLKMFLAASFQHGFIHQLAQTHEPILCRASSSSLSLLRSTAFGVPYRGVPNSPQLSLPSPLQKQEPCSKTHALEKNASLFQATWRLQTSAHHCNLSWLTGLQRKLPKLLGRSRAPPSSNVTQPQRAQSKVSANQTDRTACQTKMHGNLLWSPSALISHVAEVWQSVAARGRAVATPTPLEPECRTCRSIGAPLLVPPCATTKGRPFVGSRSLLSSEWLSPSARPRQQDIDVG